MGLSCRPSVCLCVREYICDPWANHNQIHTYPYFENSFFMMTVEKDNSTDIIFLKHLLRF